jgi:hypothetical protein
MQDESVAILVPFSRWSDWVGDCVRACGRLQGATAAWELWLIPDEMPDTEHVRQAQEWAAPLQVMWEPTGPANPSRKRNAALKKTKASRIALVDSDAWPASDWLSQALPHLRGKVGIVAGPNLTPDHDALTRRVCGRVMESKLGFGDAYIRHICAPMQDVREMPTCNMVYRRAPEINFREDLDTGEDMVFCADMRARGQRILYHPGVRVYHHRRSLWRPFYMQFYGYGFHKGQLQRQKSDIAYWWQAMPALLTIYLVAASVLTFVLPYPWQYCVWGPGLLYAALVAIESARRARDPIEFLVAMPAFFVGHVGYGTGYIKGFLSRGTQS